VTERLYYTSSSLTAFDADVLEATTGADGRPAVRLDRTAFYPTSGGQPFDTGQLGPARVIEVLDGDDGSILHVIDRAIPTGTVHGEVDWERRFDHMQQHTGQHVLSAAFERVAGVATVSFHLGDRSSTIDLAREVSAREVEQAEDEANRIVWADRPVTIRFVSAEEAASLPLRKAPAREGTLRLIEIPDVDMSACGGTHVERTGAIGIIAVASAERFKGGTRLEFVCGRRALRSHRAVRDLVGSGARALSVGPAELPGAIERLQTEAQEARRHLKDLRSRLARHEADALASSAEAVGNVRFAIAALEGFDAGGLKQIASAIASHPGHAALLIGLPSPSPIVVARATDVSVDSGALLKQMIGRFGGKGGGRPDLAQGGGLEGSAAEMLAFARQAAGVPR